MFAENLKIANFEWGQLYKMSEIKEEAKYPLSFFFLIVSLSLSNTIHPVAPAQSFIWLSAGSWHFLCCHELLENSWGNLGHLDVWCAFLCEKKIKWERELIIFNITKCFCLDFLYPHGTYDFFKENLNIRLRKTLPHLTQPFGIHLLSIYYFLEFGIRILIRTRWSKYFMEREKIALWLVLRFWCSWVFWRKDH